MRMIIVGQGPFGEKVLEILIRKGEEVVGVFCPPDKRGEPMRSLAEKSGIFFSCPNHMKDPEVSDVFKKLEPDLVIEAFVTDIIPQGLLNIPSIGTICYHPSLLPRHRGASAINWAIAQGDSRTGLTIFWVDRGIDTGPILLQKEVEIGPNDTTGSIYFNTLFPLGVDAIVEAVELIKRGEAPKIPQDDSKATYEPPFDGRFSRIDFEKSVRDVYNLIRGSDPQPGAFTTFKGEKISLYEASLIVEPVEKVPGEIVTVEKEGLQIVAKGGILKVGKLRVDKGEKTRPMEFVKAVDLKIGDRFGE